MKKFKKIIFWFFVILTLLVFIPMLATSDGRTIIVPMGIILSTPWALYYIIKHNIKTNAKKKLEIKEKELTIEETYLSNGFKMTAKYNENMLLVNEDTKQFTLGEEVYYFKDLITAEIIEDDDVLTTTTTKNKASLGKALVGGAIFGGVGAIIGGNAGKSKSTSKNYKVCDKLQIKLTFNSVSQPVKYINLIKSRTRKDMRKYKQAHEVSEHFLGVFQVIINNK